MGHNLEQLGTASLDTMGGLITFAGSRDVPEGASPRNWDVDYMVGRVATRPGLQSVYSFSTALEITGFSLNSSNVATFTFVGLEPAINEGFLLSNFLGIMSPLNGQEVYVETTSLTQFTAVVNNGPYVTVTGLSGIATSTTGLFVGPNVGASAVGPLWTNPSNISSPTAYASIDTNTNVNVTGIPTAAVSFGKPQVDPGWFNPTNIYSTSAYTTVNLTNQTSAPLQASGLPFNIPTTATVTGLVVSLNAANLTVSSASAQLSVYFANANGTALGIPQTFGIGTSYNTYVKGSSQYQWGTTFTPSEINNGLQVFLVAQSSGTGGATFSANSLSVTVYYTTSDTSDTLQVQEFSFAVALNTGVTGFAVSFNAYTDNASSLKFQMLQNGIPVGTVKEVALTSSPTVYTLGGASDSWGGLWTAANVDSVTFGVQLTATGDGHTYAGDLDMTVFVTPTLANFNWVGSYEQSNDSLTTLALDASGNVWQEDAINNPGYLSLSLAGIIPGSFANGATIDDSEFVMFSDLTVGTDRPRQLYRDGNWYPVSQVGPGVPPAFQAQIGSIGGILQLTQYSWSTGIAAFTFGTTTAPTVGSLYVIAGTGTPLDGQVVIVLSSPSPTGTTFSAEVTGSFPSGPTTITGTASPQFSYAIASITQPAAYTHFPAGIGFFMGPSPGVQGTGTCVTVYYSIADTPPDPALVPFNQNIATYVYITGAVSGSYDFNGVWQVVSVGSGNYPGTGEGVNYFTITYPTSGTFGNGISGARYRVTGATLTMNTPVANLSPGTQFTITGATPSGWNNTWTVSQSVNDGQYTITTTQYDGVNTATYGYQLASLTNNQVPIAGKLINITGCTNNAGFNGTFVIANVSGSTFTVNITLPIAAEPSPVPESSAQAIMFGTVFNFDPGELYVGTNTNVIYGNDSGTGTIAVIGSSLVPIGAGTRQAVVFFITNTGFWTPASPPVTFTVASDSNLLNVSSIPIGPSNVVARAIAITEAGANGVPGANFYVITEPVTNTVGTVTTTYSSTIINDNTSTTASFSFTDAVLLNSQEIDIPGFNQFNLIELGSCAWCVPYASRMFYGLQLNKVQNFNNLSFDGGYNTPNQPAGWNLFLTANEIQLINSPVTGSALYIANTTGSIQAAMGTMSQTAYQDQYNVDIISPNTAYSVRVACSCPSGIRLGTLEISLVSLSGGSFGTVYGVFTEDLANMVALPSVFSGTLLNAGVFTGTVPSTLQLRVRIINMGVGADCLIDRMEVYPTLFPYLKTEVYGSYINKPEAIDASGDGGIIDTSTENPQPCYGGFVMRDQLYLLKSSSMYSTRDNPNSEPGGWSLTEISNRVGACGINAYDVGEEWAVMACRNGIYGFDGGKPEPLNLEIMQVWNCINFDAGNSICIRNDTANRRILCAVPLPTGTSPEGVATATVQWLPYAPYNPAPTTPNVILMLNYQALGSFAELMSAIGTHATMFGSLANPDMRRKWSIWQIPTPYMGMITRTNLLDTPIFVCNGIASSKIYVLDDDQTSDDGAAIYSLYTTYGHVNAVKAATLPIFGMHTKRYTVLQANLSGSGTCSVRMIPNDLSARYPYSVPGGITLNSPVDDDYFRPINCKGQRLFLEFSTNAVGSWFELNKTLLTGKADPWSSLNPTGGGNMGVQ